MIGAVQWTVSLSRFDIAHAVMSLGRFRANPRQGHLERLRRLFGYMKKRRGGAIRFRTGIPDWENAFPEPIKYDWMDPLHLTFVRRPFGRPSLVVRRQQVGGHEFHNSSFYIGKTLECSVLSSCPYHESGS
eukprot:scaffold20686_cov137-Amphora_coffeaeformis.AAC.1